MKIWFQNKRSKFKKSQRKGSKRLAENEGDKCGVSDEEEEGDELDGEEGEEEEGPLTDNDDSDNADKSDPDYSRKSDSENVMRDGKGAPNKEQSDSGISGISGTCSPSLTASNASTTPPLALERSGSVQWASPPYSGGEYEGSVQQGESVVRYGHGFCGHLPLRLAQPLSASSPSYHGYQAAPHHYHFGGPYLQQQQSLAYQQHGYGLGYARN